MPRINRATYFGGILMLACGSDAESPKLTFVVEFVGNTSALSQSSLSYGDRLEKIGPVRLSGTNWPSTYNVASATIINYQGSNLTGSVVVSPFVCNQNKSEFQRLADLGWTATEKHQVFVEANGNLEIGTNFEHLLVNQCLMGPLSGEQFHLWTYEGSSPPYCNSVDRKATQIEILGSVLGLALDRTPKTCESGLSKRTTPPNLVFTFASQRDDYSFSVLIKVFALPVDSVFPIAYTLPSEEVLVRATIIEKDNLQNSDTVFSGDLRIDSLSFDKAGRVTGRIETSLGFGADVIKVQGSIDLPLLQEPPY